MRMNILLKYIENIVLFDLTNKPVLSFYDCNCSLLLVVKFTADCGLTKLAFYIFPPIYWLFSFLKKFEGNICGPNRDEIGYFHGIVSRHQCVCTYVRVYTNNEGDIWTAT